MRAIASSGLPVTIIDAENGFTTQLVSGENLLFATLPHYGRGRMTMVPRGLGKILRSGDLVFLHEGWTVSNLVAAAICKIKQLPYVVLPHGVYDPQLVRDLRGGWVRRRLERWVLEQGLAVHLFFDQEIAHVKAIAPEAVTLTSMTGLDMPTRRWAESPHEDYFAWLARYDIHHKGIDVLMMAIANTPAHMRPRLIMHGPDHRGDRQRTRELVAQLGLDGVVDVRDEIAPVDAQEFMLRSSGFVHIPRWEAFGRTIVESISLGVPTVLSRGAHIAQQLTESGASILVEEDGINLVESLTRAKIDADSLSELAVRWSEDNLSWADAVDRLKKGLRQRNVSFEEPHDVHQARK